MRDAFALTLSRAYECLIPLFTAKNENRLYDKILDLFCDIVDFDVSSVAFFVPGLDDEGILHNKIIGFRGAFPPRYRRAYEDYYYRRPLRSFIYPGENGFLSPIDCLRMDNDEFAVDFLRPQGIWAFCGDRFIAPSGAGFLYYAFNSASYSEAVIKRNLTVLKAVHSLVQVAIDGVRPRQAQDLENHKPVAKADAIRALSPREQEVAPLLAERLTANEIGERLGISRRTTETHIQNIYQKLGVSDRHSFISMFDRS
jgi:DNA-binding CsgD family transcriptional regulator